MAEPLFDYEQIAAERQDQAALRRAYRRLIREQRLLSARLSEMETRLGLA